MSAVAIYINLVITTSVVSSQVSLATAVLARPYI